VRAVRDYAEQQPDFSVSAGLIALYWMSHGYGYQITATDVLDAYKSLMLAVNHAGIAEAQIKARIQETLGTVTIFLSIKLCRYLCACFKSQSQSRPSIKFIIAM
jgi:hypothetical protein